MNKQELESVAQSLVAKGEGILAADESTGTITKRLASVNVASTEETRRTYRGLLFSTPGVEAFISGVIMYDETIRQEDDDGVAFPKLLASRGIIPGIKVDTGAKALAGYLGERVTEGLDGLRDRLVEYYGMGARFAKWRAVITIGEGLPTSFCIHANAHALARYAALCQEAGLVPIVEPEVLMEGDHPIDRCREVTERTLREVFSELSDHRVMLEGMLLKPNMILPGNECPEQVGVKEVARATVRSLRRVIPPAVPGVVFLSGGQSAILATEHLNAMNAMGAQPWALSFSYGRALQRPTLDAWHGETANALAAQKLFYHRAKCNGAARLASYTEAMEASVG